MSHGEVAAVLGVTVTAPFVFALLFLAAGGVPRIRKFLAVACSLSVAGLSLALLSGFLTVSGEPGWGSLVLTRFGFPPFLILNLVGAAVVLYAGFKKTNASRPALLMASIPAGLGLAGLALLASGLLSVVLLWEGVTAVAVLGLLSQGGGGVRRRLRKVVPWLAGDLLFVAGAVLSAVWLDEARVFIEAPLTSGSEAQVIVVMVLFLTGAMIRLGVFPFHSWVADILGYADPAWSAFFMGAANYLLAGARLLVAAVLLARLVAGDWSAALVAIGLASALAGAVVVNRRTVQGYLSGMYTMQAGFLVVGAGLFSRIGLEGALFCFLVTPLFLSPAIMAAGSLLEMRGTGSLGRQRLSARRAPAAFTVLLLSGMSLAGLPPVAGFVGKAIVALGNMDKAAVSPFYALAAAVALAAVALAAVATVRMLGGAFAGEGDAGTVGKPAFMESVAPLALCGGSLLVGLFPGILMRNFTDPGSLWLFPSGFSGPGVVFKGAGAAVEGAVQYYLSWSAVPAAFALLVAALALAVYFASRAAHPSRGTPARLGPFLGGATGEYRPSMEPGIRLARPQGKRGRGETDER